MGDYIIFNTSALVTVNVGGNPIEHLLTKVLVMVSAFWLLVTGLTEFGEGISQYQHILFTIS